LSMAGVGKRLAIGCVMEKIPHTAGGGGRGS
jgi:hypothetical protein